MDTVDLHVHTTFSDGTFTPEELVLCAKEKGLKAVAITDHDTFDGLPEAISAGNKYGMEIIPGVEFSTVFEGIVIHILGLLVDYDANRLKEVSESFGKRRDARNLKMIALLQQEGLDISFIELENYCKEDILSRTHFAALIRHKGYVPSIKEAFRKYLSPWCPSYVPMESPAASDTIQLIRSLGGIPSLAHPLAYGLEPGHVEKMVSRLSKRGLLALECIYPRHTKKDEEFLLRLCSQYKLITSGGSDFHGTVRPENDLGCAHVPASVLENLKQLKGVLKMNKVLKKWNE